MKFSLNAELSRQILRLAYPLILANVSLTLLNVVDTAMLGRLTPAALAAAGMGGLVFSTFLFTLGSIREGTQALVARR
ncbi:MAG: MATE family efflux transporter, partial [Proteobacteria bacterium]|nr:MATE family efflux transporter [Pseudomonadota bacterium]